MGAPTEAMRLAARVRPSQRAVLWQRWSQLLFLHWAWDPEVVQRTLPSGLTVDTFQGRAWVGLVPFFMQKVRPPYCPSLPGISNFLELNVRTYVFDGQGRPGVWFYSLDANQWLAVKVARTWFHLPYQHAEMSATIGADGAVDYRARRMGEGHESRFRYRASAAGQEVAPGSLDFFLIERYRLFAEDQRGGGLYSGRVAHAPYRVSAVDVPGWDDSLLRLAGFGPAERDVGKSDPDHVCMAGAVDVDVFGLRRVEEPIRQGESVNERMGDSALPA